MCILLPVDIDEDQPITAADAATSLPDAAGSVGVTDLNVQPEVDVTGGDGEHVSSEDWYDEDEFLSNGNMEQRPKSWPNSTTSPSG